MPDSFWYIFGEAKKVLSERDELKTENLREEMEAQMHYLLHAGGLDKELDVIIERLQESSILEASYASRARQHLQAFAIEQLVNREPATLAQAIAFRTGRQRWCPYELSDVPYRQFVVDIIQAVLGASYRKNDWPYQSRSFAVRAVERQIAARLQAAGRVPGRQTAFDLLQRAAGWENELVSLRKVLEEFFDLIGKRLLFHPPSLDELISQEGGDDDEF